MRIFVTGGAGYVGSACLRHLLEKGHDAVAYDNLRQGHRDAVPHGRLIVGDLADAEGLRLALRDHRSEGVMHFAAATCVGESVEDPEYHYRNNVGGTMSLLNAMRDVGVKRLLFSSTCATYGLSPSNPMRESAPQNPCSPYARTKLSVEWMIRDFSRAYGFAFTLLRYFNAAGASSDGRHGEDHSPETHLIALAFKSALGLGGPLRLFGTDYPTPDGTCIRDYVHVDDLASAHLLAIEAMTPDTREVYNIGTGKGHSVLEVLAACERVSGSPIPREIDVRREGDPPELVADPSKLVTALGWRPRHAEILAIVQTAWDWHRAHPRGYGQAAAR